ncbi:hypothetical protein B296_00024378 [Ensete ventricosum]|uniref:SURP motif domain-containing protein n=1 Tax=Ensete ventricosum TaxID=4639 RepID=A0A426ZKL9_ENSVE|nr:hypothetical protein B296_00024378 [Ensete ventricosum]
MPSPSNERRSLVFLAVVLLLLSANWYRPVAGCPRAGLLADRYVLPVPSSMLIMFRKSCGYLCFWSILSHLGIILIFDQISLSLSEARREARKAFLAFSGNEGGAETAKEGSHVWDSEEYAERVNNGLYTSKSMPVSNLTGNDFLPFYSKIIGNLHQSGSDWHGLFSAPLESATTIAELPPPEVPPPEDNNLKLLIDGFATLVARCGKIFEDLSKEKNRSNPLFYFLSGGDGHNYYKRKLWEEKQRSVNHLRLVEVSKSKSSTQTMTAESRGRILGEKKLERTSNDTSSSVAVKEFIHLQSNLADTFTKPVSLVGLLEVAKPFKDDPAKQERFEQFLKDKYEGGLRSTQPSGIMSENDRARERLDFEAAAEAIEKGESKKLLASSSMEQFTTLSGVVEQQFIASTGLTVRLLILMIDFALRPRDPSSAVDFFSPRGEKERLTYNERVISQY